MNRLVLIDGNAILHRAYHALPPLTAPDGSPVGAVYGFTAMLFKLVNDLKPTHLAVAFDRPKPTFRQDIFKEYQAQRPQMDTELVPQVGKVHDLLTAFGIPIYEVNGFEADDVIATITAQAQKERIDQVIIVTGDRDLLQLVDENTFLYMPTKGLSEARLYDPKAVKEKMGVLPRQIPDFKALAGDASDNYPGVPGVGPKTAAQLLNQFGSLEALYKAKQKLPEALTKKLEDGQKSADLGKQLATVRTDAPIEVDFSKTSLITLNTPSGRRALEDLHFPSLLKRLSK
ncbi:MAG: 5'-3' exonuclease, partial [Patescibacteria group bacterium]